MKRFFALLVLLATPAYSAPLPYYFTHRMPLFDVVGSASPRGGSGGTSSNIFASGLVLNDDQVFNLGTTNSSARPALQYNTTQTVDTGMLLTGTISNHWVVAERQDNGFDFAHAATTNPTLFIHSNNQSTTQWLSLTNNATDGVINVGAGGIVLQTLGNTRFYYDTSITNLGSNEAFGFASATAPTSANQDVILRRKAAAVLQMGADVNGALTAQQFQGPNGITGTDIAGGKLTLGGQVGTGAGAASQTNINRALMLGTGTSAQSSANGVSVCESKTLSNTTGTATALANVGLASNAAGGARITVTVTCTNGTEFAASTTTSFQSFANKAGTISFGTATTQTESNGASTGATINCTVAPTWVANANSVDIKVTPVITGAATTTTGYINVENLGAGAVTCQ